MEIAVLYTVESRSRYFLSYDDAFEYVNSAAASETDDYFGVQVVEDFDSSLIPSEGRMWYSQGRYEGQRSWFEGVAYDEAVLVPVKL